MMKQTFSVNAAALLLDRDRRTVTKALPGIAPDAKVKGQGQWLMRTVVDALAVQERPAAAAAVYRGDNPPEYAAFDRAFAELEALPTVPARRKAAIAIMPLLHDMIAALTKQGLEGGQHPEHTQLRGDGVYRLTMLGFQEPCAWSHDEVWENLNQVGFDADELA